METAEQEYRVGARADRRLEEVVFPEGREVLNNCHELFRQGQTDAIAYLDARREFNDLVRRHAEAATRHRRSVLDLNTAVGRRILP